MVTEWIPWVGIVDNPRPFNSSGVSLVGAQPLAFSPYSLSLFDS